MLPGILTTEVAEKTHGKTASGVPITNKARREAGRQG
jgi:hypothetical protein